MSSSVCFGTLKTVEPADLIGVHSKRHLLTMFGLRDPKQPLIIDYDQASFTADALESSDRMLISGVQKKLLCTLRNGVLTAHPRGEYIVKPTPDRLPSLSENEHLCMMLAKAIGLNVAETSLVPFNDGQLCLVSKRFDLLPDGQKDFIEDAASIMEVHPKHKESDANSYENTLIALYKASADKKNVLLDGFKQVLFSFIIGNNDLHLKNFSMYRKASSRSTTMMGFTPIYDVLSAMPYPAYYGEYLSFNLLESEVNGTYSTSYDNYGYYTRHDFLLLGKNIGLPEVAVVKTIKSMISALTTHSPGILEASPCAADVKTKINQSITEKTECLLRPIIETRI
jgi:serine/threonine-protein kinase HipA